MCLWLLQQPTYTILAFTILLKWTVYGDVNAGGLMDMNRLHNDLLQNYSVNLWPKMNKTTPVEVTVQLTIMTVFELCWKDIRLKWSPEDYGNITSMTVPQHFLARPDIVLYNSVEENVYFGVPENQIIVYYNGTLVWIPPFISTFRCVVNIAKYPVDVNMCEIILAPWADDNSIIKLVITDPPFLMEETVDNGQFYITPQGAELEVYQYKDVYYEKVYFFLKLERRSTEAWLSVLFPMFLMGLLCPLSFLIPPDNAEKVSVSITVLLSTAVFIGVIHGYLPERSDMVSSAAIYVVSLLSLSYLGVLGNTIILLVHKHDKERQLHEEKYSLSVMSSAYSSFDETHPLGFSAKRAFQRLDEMGKTMPHPPGDPPISTVQPPLGDTVDVVKSAYERTRAAKLNWALFIASAVILSIITAANLIYIYV